MKMHDMATKLFTIPRSITGEGFLKSLQFIKDEVEKDGDNFKLNITSVKSGTKCFDWTIPPEWVVRDAYIITPDGKKICEFSKNTLNLVNYSEKIHKKMHLNELLPHLYSLPHLPNAIPYVTSYYERRWGFCISKKELDTLKDGVYEVFIDTDFKDDGSLYYGELFIPATTQTKDEVLFSTYLCHPQMANNELSGPVVMAKLIEFVKSLQDRRYNYRFLIIPETIGSITYISRHFNELKQNVKAAFVLSCLGDEKAYSVVLSQKENSLSDKIALHTIKHLTKNPKIYSFLHRGSDERQFNTPSLNLGAVAICRSKFGEFKEYHNSLDDLNFVTQKGLTGGLKYAKNIVLNLETNAKFKLKTVCEPNLGSRGLISTINKGAYPKQMLNIRHFLAYCDGETDALEIADILGIEVRKLKEIIDQLIKFDLIKEVK